MLDLIKRKAKGEDLTPEEPEPEEEPADLTPPCRRAWGPEHAAHALERIAVA